MTEQLNLIQEEINKSEIPEFIYLREHYQENEFFSSLMSQLLRKGTLSEKQLACIRRAMTKHIPEAQPETEQKTFSIQAGNILELKPWISTKLREQLGLGFFLRNIEVTNVVSETAKAYIIDFKFVSKVLSCCHVCGRNLEDEVSKAVGVGPVCAVNIGLKRPTTNEAHLFLAEFEALCVKAGVFKNICIPKSQIRKITG